MLFVVFRNINDYLSIIFDGYKPQIQQYEILLDKRIKNNILGIVNAFHNSVSLNKKWSMPLKKIWYPTYVEYALIDAAVEQQKEVVFVFFEGNRLAYQEKFLNFLKSKYPRAAMVFRFVNIVDQNDLQDLEFVKKHYDFLISMDKADCEKYHLEYCPNTFWIDEKMIESKESSDVLFLGADKGRAGLLMGVYDELVKNGYKCLFFLAKEKEKNDRLILKKINVIKGMPYLDYLGYVKNAKALLEILSDGQAGSTLRAVEAAYFGKMLITNNKNVTCDKYYNENATVLFDSPEEICERIGTLECKAAKNKNIVSHDMLFRLIDRLVSQQRKK